MADTPTYEELEQRVRDLEKDAAMRTQTEGALRESQQTLEMAIEATGAAFFERKMNLLEGTVNENWLNMFGVKPHDFPSPEKSYEWLFGRIHPDDRERWAKNLSDFAEGRSQKYNNLFRVMHKSGDYLWIEARGRATERDEEGKPKRMVGLLIDITERKRSEEVLQKAYDDLELKVEARTKDLLKTNAKLVQEIKERRQAEEALRESEEKYRSFVEVTSDWIWEMNDQGVFTYVDPKIKNFIGYEAEDVIGRSMSDFMPEEDGKRSRHFLCKYNKLRKPFPMVENTHIHKNGTEVICETSGVPTFAKDGKLTGWKGLNKDISERKRAEEELRKSEERYRLLIDSFDGLIHGYDKEGNVLFMNIRGARDFGTIPEDLYGKSLYDMMPDIAEFLVERHREIIDSGVGKTFEDSIKLPTGDFWMWSNVQPLKDAEGKIHAVQIISYEITELKRAEEELRRLRNYLSNIINSMPSVLVGVDPGGIITQWNTEAKRATGVSVKDAVGQPLSQAFPHLATEMERVREAMQTREVRSDLRHTREEDGETRYEDVTVYPLIDNGIQGAVIRVDDVTERVRIAEMMIQSEKMMSVGGLAAGMAHEINNPLAGILQNVQVMRNRLSGDLSKNRAMAEECGTSMEAIESYMENRGMFRIIDAVMESGKRAAKIVSNMLSFSRKGDESFAPHSLCDLLDQTVELAQNDYDLKKKFDFRQIEIVKKYDRTTPEVMCEGSKIQQVFLNILKNGAQAMTESREQETANGLRKAEERIVPRFILRVMPDGEMARIEIEDNGPGMDEETRKHVFEPFFTTKPVGMGTGLGLSVSYFIITENHGGTMAVESPSGKGAKFIIRLPIERNVR